MAIRMECPLQSEPHRPLRLLSLPHFIMLSDTGRGSDHALSHVNRPFTSQSGCHFFPQKARGFLGFGLDVPHAVVQLLSNVWLFATPWTAARQASLSFTVSQSLPKLLSVELVVPSNPHPLLPSPPALNLSQHQGPHTFSHMPCTTLPEPSTWIRTAVDLPPFPARPYFLLKVRISSCSLLYSGFLPHCEVLVRGE